jgi:hypothetical protein
MSIFGTGTSKLALPSFLVFGAMSVVAADLSKYRDFQFGANLSTVARQAGMNPSEAKVIHSRPVLLQELTWRPQPLGSSTHMEPAEEVVFRFYNSELFQIEINYDRHETEGLTPGDLVDAISATYGTATKHAAPPQAATPTFGEQEELQAEWQDPEYRFYLVRSSYGPNFKLVGVLKRLEEPVQTAKREAARLDAEESPQKEANRTARQNEVERIRLEQARLVNKRKFRP